ncbi:methionyl-tRNA formyltransferase [Salegentibacter mishustinae]|uniref:methionyl-tRNA formyltransferase n=1 Tax=Salegentibacter mishustinae TaxID=270918 RepID=UPI001CE08CB1|nr:methionyl-tRNA formyltransferase [Salegentibacter mishustinae]UBZ06396.1 methionyl-tRNA formyltransferase [Salegentibacter mishustinae]
MRSLRIVFMGTPDFAVASLESILDANYNVVGVITAPDKPAGRGRKLQESPVKKFAVSKGLKVLQPTNLKDGAFIDELKALDPNVQVVVAFRMLPKVVWDLPQFGTFNLHASLLPQYRGAAPINWAIINNEKKTGVSTFFLDEKIDTGAMILQKEINIAAEESVGELHDKLMELGAGVVVETLELIEKGNLTPTPQPFDQLLKDAPKLNKENTKINWDDSLDQIYNLIRGLNPYPAAWSILFNDGKEEKVKIYHCQKEIASHFLENGSILVEDKKLKVATEGGYLIIEELQLPGKRKMDVKSLLNGYDFSKGAKFL